MDLVKARKRAEALKAKEEKRSEATPPVEERAPSTAKKAAPPKATPPKASEKKKSRSAAPKKKATPKAKAKSAQPAKKAKAQPQAKKKKAPSAKAQPKSKPKPQPVEAQPQPGDRAQDRFSDLPPELLEGPPRHHSAPSSADDPPPERPTAQPEAPEDAVADFDPAIHFVDFQAQRERDAAADATPHAQAPDPPPEPPVVVRDVREDPSFEEILKPRPRDGEVLGLMNGADSNPNYPDLDLPESSVKRNEPLASLMEDALEKGLGATESAAFDEIWDDEEAKLLGLVAEELFRRAYGEETAREEAGQKFIGFQLAGEHYAISILEVGEVVKMKERTPVPHAPDHVAGIIGLRGAIIPVVDLRRWLGLPEKELVRSARILILKKGNRRLGFIVDHVLGVVKIPPASIEPAPASINKIGAEFISGVGRLEGRFFVLLNTDRLIEITRKSETSTKAEAS